jgi:hypothetical protein
MMNTNNYVSIFLLFLMLSVLAACSPVVGVFDVSIQPAEQEAEGSALESVRPVALSLLDSQYNWQDYIQFLTTPCTTVDGLGGPPKCETGMADGTPVEVFPLSDAEGHFATPETIDQVLKNWLKRLYAAYKVPSDAYQEPYWPAGEFGLLFERDVNDVPFPVTVFVEDGKIVRIAYHYNTVEEQLQSIPVENVIIPPSEIDAWLYPEGK